MSDNLIQKSCVAFTEALASKEPVPGGGGAAALVGALGTALCSMVGNLTIGRKKYAAVEEDVKIMQTKARKIYLRLLQLVDEDAAAFAPLSKAYSIPKDKPGRAETLEKVTLDACRAPVEMMRYICMAIDLLEEMLEKGSSMVRSDVGCGALFCKAALESAGINIFVNTKSLPSNPAAQSMNEEADNMLRAYSPKAQKIADEVTHCLRQEA